MLAAPGAYNSSPSFDYEFQVTVDALENWDHLKEHLQEINRESGWYGVAA